MPRCCTWTACRAGPLQKKLSGVYQSARVEDDPLFFGMTPQTAVPHSRRNDIAEADLVARGYRVLSRLSSGQADIFTREPPGHSRFVFLQGHPEYDSRTLGREYLRDMERFLKGEAPTPPAMPENYFDRATEDRLAAVTSNDIADHAAIVNTALPLQAWRPRHRAAVRQLADACRRRQGAPYHLARRAYPQRAS